MQDLLQDLRQTSYENYDKRIEKRKQEQEKRPIHMKNLMEKLLMGIQSDAKEKMKTASIDGYYSASLFSFEPVDVCDEGNMSFKYTFLFRGPKYDTGNGCGMEYFEKLRIIIFKVGGK